LGGFEGGGVDEVVAEGVDQMVVFAVLEGEFGAAGGVVVGAEGTDEAGAAGVDEEARGAEGGFEGEADEF
jgi:hypothetical protein